MAIGAMSVSLMKPNFSCSFSTLVAARVIDGANNCGTVPSNAAALPPARRSARRLKPRTKLAVSLLITVAPPFAIDRQIKNAAWPGWSFPRTAALLVGPPLGPGDAVADDSAFAKLLYKDRARWHRHGANLENPSLINSSVFLVPLCRMRRIHAFTPLMLLIKARHDKILRIAKTLGELY